MNTKTGRYLVAGWAAAGLLLASGCGGIVEQAAGSLVGGDVKNATTLWTDVPLVEGAVKGDFDMPLAARLVMRAVTAGAGDMIAYSTTKSPQDIEAYYTLTRMKASGWTEGGCAGDAIKSAAGSSNDPNAAQVLKAMGDLNFCGFNKSVGGKDEVLLVFAIPPDAKDSVKTTKLIFFRGVAPKQQ